MRNLYLSACMLLALPAASALEVVAGEAPAAFIETATSGLLARVARLRDAEVGANAPGSTERIAGWLAPLVDAQTAAKLVLGPHWRRAAPDERRRFLHAFRSLVLTTYASTMLRSGDPVVRFLPAPAATGGGRALVRSAVTLVDGRVIRVDYRVLRREGRWRIYDLVVEGMSLLQVWRAEFAAQMRRGGMPALLAELEARRAGVPRG